MRYKEFEEKIKELGLEVIDSEYSIRVFTQEGYYTSEVSKEETYKANISPSEIGKSLKEKVLNLCVELAKTPIEEREDEKRFIIPLPGLITTDGKQQYLTYKDCKFFASRGDEALRQIWKEEHLELIPEVYRQFAVEFDEKEY